jgi:hypothetical protein
MHFFSARRAAMMLAVSVLAGMAGACAMAPSSAPPNPLAAIDPADEETAVMVVDRGRHTDIILAADALNGPAAALRRDFPGAIYFVFGFGDRAYLMARDVSFTQTLAALFPGPGVILVTALRTPPAEAFGADNVVTLHLSCARRDALSHFIEAALAEDTHGALLHLGDGPYPGSAFYGTDAIYDLFHDCNRWTAAALRSGGFAITAEGVIVASQVMTQIQPLAARQPSSAAMLAPCPS